MKFFLGSVPFGCDNIGDEAILEGIIKILRRNFDSPEITVATAKPSQASALFNVNAVGLYGFDENLSLESFANELKKNDVFIWSGATGLSDYPKTALKILSLAQSLGLKTVVWNVGMDSVLNPAFFKLAGKKKLLCQTLSKLCFNRVDFSRLLENKLIKNQRKDIAKILRKTDLIELRDFQSKAELDKCSKHLNANVGADSAIVLEKSSDSFIDELPEKIKCILLNKELKKIALCVSSQRSVSNLEGLAKTMDLILQKDKNRRLLLLPMNPLTDSKLMAKLPSLMKNAENVCLLENIEDPKCVMNIASKCEVVISSRLHLLILSSVVATPIIGISRGSKVDNYLSGFDIKSVGNVYNCNFEMLANQAEFYLENGKLDFEKKQKLVFENLFLRLQKAEEKLRECLGN